MRLNFNINTIRIKLEVKLFFLLKTLINKFSPTTEIDTYKRSISSSIFWYWIMRIYMKLGKKYLYKAGTNEHKKYTKYYYDYLYALEQLKSLFR